MISVRQAFDRHAANYDRVFPCSAIRSEIWEIADKLFTSGMRILDLGCGTGDDAVHLFRRGVDVTAVDIAPAMIAQLKVKTNDAVRCIVGDMRTLDWPAEPFDGIISSFGALNCAPDLDWLNRFRLAPGSYLVLTLIGRFYPLETIAFLMKGQLQPAFRRFVRSPRVQVEGVAFNVHHHSLRAVQIALGAKFELIEVKGLRSLLPSPNFSHLERFTALRYLKRADRWLCSHRLTATLADHFVSVWRYDPS